MRKGIRFGSASFLCRHPFGTGGWYCKTRMRGWVRTETAWESDPNSLTESASAMGPVDGKDAVPCPAYTLARAYKSNEIKSVLSVEFT